MLNRNNLLFTLLKLKSKTYCILPRALTLTMGRMTGRFLYYFFPLRKKVAIINIKIAFPNISEADLKKVLKKCYLHVGMLISDFLRLPIISMLAFLLFDEIPQLTTLIGAFIIFLSSFLIPNTIKTNKRNK